MEEIHGLPGNGAVLSSGERELRGLGEFHVVSRAPAEALKDPAMKIHVYTPRISHCQG